MAQAEHIKDLHKNEGGLQFDRRHINVVRNAVKGVRSDLSTAIYGKFVSVIEHNDDTALIGGVQHLCVDLLYLCGIIISCLEKESLFHIKIQSRKWAFPAL